MLICLVFEKFRSIALQFGFKFIAFEGSISNVHEILKLKALLREEVLGHIFAASVGDIELVFEVKVVGNFTSIHSL